MLAFQWKTGARRYELTLEHVFWVISCYDGRGLA